MQSKPLRITDREESNEIIVAAHERAQRHERIVNWARSHVIEWRNITCDIMTINTGTDWIVGPKIDGKTVQLVMRLRDDTTRTFRESSLIFPSDRLVAEIALAMEADYVTPRTEPRLDPNAWSQHVVEQHFGPEVVQSIPPEALKAISQAVQSGAMKQDQAYRFIEQMLKPAVIQAPPADLYPSMAKLKGPTKPSSYAAELRRQGINISDKELEELVRGGY